MKTFGHKRPRRDAQGNITALVDCPAQAVTREACGGSFGADSKRRLVVSLEAGDLVCVRPQRTNRVYRVAAKDLFHWLLRSEANLLALARARDMKAKRAARLARQRQERAEKRLVEKGRL